MGRQRWTPGSCCSGRPWGWPVLKPEARDARGHINPGLLLPTEGSRRLWLGALRARSGWIPGSEHQKRGAQRGPPVCPHPVACLTWGCFSPHLCEGGGRTDGQLARQRRGAALGTGRQVMGLEDTPVHHSQGAFLGPPPAAARPCWKPSFLSPPAPRSRCSRGGVAAGV